MGSLAKHCGLDSLKFREIPQHEFVHCIIDVQREFCDPEYSTRRGNEETVRVSKHIADVASDFRKAHIPTYMVYFARDTNEPPDTACGGLYNINMEEGDVPIAKSTDSAFKSSNICELLKSSGIKTLLVSGFNTSACVHDTVVDALKEGFDVWLLEDCVGNDQYNPRDPSTQISNMKEKGALCKHHADALNQVNCAVNRPPAEIRSPTQTEKVLEPAYA